MIAEPTAVELDARDLPPSERHALIFRLLDGLAPGQTLMLTTDHDPAPLGRQLAASRPRQYDWACHEQGPSVWRIAITRGAAGEAFAGQSVAAVVARHPATLEVFRSFGIDLCCGGNLSVAAAAESHAIPLAAVTGALYAALPPLE